MNDQIKCVNCGDYDCNWEGHQDGTTECLNCGHDRTTGEKVSDKLELPVAAKWIEFEKLGDSFSEGADLMVESGFDAKLSHQDEFVKKEDAEEAIQEARREERQEILDKIEDKIRDMEDRKNDISNQDLQESEVAQKLFSEYRAVKGQLEELREDLASSSHSDSAEGLRDELQQEECESE